MNDTQTATSEPTVDIKRLKKRVYTRMALAPVILGAAFFPLAGTLRFWQAWVYIALISFPMCGLMMYLLKKDPELMERRMRTREKEAAQKKIVLIGGLFFVAGFLLPGLDRRFGWSSAPLVLVVAAEVMVALGYALFVRVLLENRYLSRIVEVDAGQKVITTGPYAVVRHPMYVGVVMMYLFSPLALGSLWGLIPMTLSLTAIPLRILNEEKVLLRDLPAYREYMEKTKYRLIPGLW